MNKLACLQKFPLKKREPNFLIGIAGNGLSTEIQKELYTSPNKDIHYFHYINFTDSSESGILLTLMNSIVKHVIGKELLESEIQDFRTPFSVFKAGIELISNNTSKKYRLTIILDEFEGLKDYSNAFFFTLDKILSISKIIPNIEITSILISDEYINPIKEKSQEGIGKLFYHHSNFYVIPAKTREEINQDNYKVLTDLDSLTIDRIYQLGGSIPSLLMSLIDISTKNNLNSEDLLENYEIEWKLEEIWNSIGKHNQEILTSVINNRPISFENKLEELYLKQTGILDINNRKFKSELFEKYITKQSKISLQNNEEYLKIFDIYIYLPNLTPQIEKILLLLYMKKNSLVTRDEIAKNVWGELKYIEKYSNYSIDKQISKLRKILKIYGLNENIIKTRKGKGYILEA